jgi:carbon-monoxide dehydrogenase medium subunit
MQPFEYVRPTALESAVALLAEMPGAARPLAGGTDLLVQLRAERLTPQRVVDVKHVAELNALRYDEAAGLTLGAAVPCYRVYEDATVRARYPGLIDAATIIGGTAIQGRASIGGNLCNASPSGDSIPSLIVHGATCLIAGPRATRSVAVEDVCVAPGTTRLEPGELLVSIQLPAPRPRSGAHYLRFIPRYEMDIAVVGAGASVVLAEDGTIADARVALGAVAPTPLLVPAAAAAVIGSNGSDEALEAAAAAAREAARPIDDMRGTAKQRRHLAGVLAKRALRGALARARGETNTNGRH